ncbi:MAG: patatin-like phospholipase family protein [Gammaproteobacteria bacterium]
MPRIGLVLPGGGARASYEAGVVQALMELWPGPGSPRIDVVTGTSAGALNVVYLASRMAHLEQGARDLAALWSSLTADRVCRRQPLKLWRRFRPSRWGSDRRDAPHPGRTHALFDTDPLRELVTSEVDWPEISRAIATGHLRGAAVTATSYTDNRSVTFYQATPEVAGWDRVRRVGMPVRLEPDHIMASIALPILFPSVRINGCDYGDGSLLQLTPLAPAIHLGAERLLIIAVHGPNRALTQKSPLDAPPSWATIAGFMLDALFLDSLYIDLERLKRINESVASGVSAPGTPLRVVETLVLSPSIDPTLLVSRHRGRFPRWLRWLVRESEGGVSPGFELESYLFFDGQYCRHLVELGYSDTLARQDEIRQFLAQPNPL